MHVLVVANETVTGRGLIEAIERRRDESLRVTVICPVNQPQRGYVVYEDTRRAAAGRRLERTLALLHEEAISAHGLVVECDPVTAVRDALAQLEPKVDEVIVATHPVQKSGWLRRNVVDRIRSCAGETPVEHVVVDVTGEGEGMTNVLVIANETVLGEALLRKIKERAERGPASFLILSPQSDPSEGAHPEAERRLKRALAELRGGGIDAHGQVAHPDPFSAAMEAIREERVDEIIVSTFRPERSGWLRRDLVERLRAETGVPVEHVVGEADVAA
jgi:sulfur carrier protein ThiS